MTEQEFERLDLTELDEDELMALQEQGYDVSEYLSSSYSEMDIDGLYEEEIGLLAGMIERG